MWMKTHILGINSMYWVIFFRVCIYIYIYYINFTEASHEGSLLPKYRDCTTSNDFELYIYYIYIIYICMCIYIMYVYIYIS